MSSHHGSCGSTSPLDLACAVHLGLHAARVSPGRVHELVLIVSFQLLLFLLLLMIELEHGLVSFAIHNRFSLRCALTLLLDFGNEFRFLVLAEIVAENLGWL